MWEMLKGKQSLSSHQCFLKHYLHSLDVHDMFFGYFKLASHCLYLAQENMLEWAFFYKGDLSKFGLNKDAESEACIAHLPNTNYFSTTFRLVSRVLHVDGILAFTFQPLLHIV
ncbi:hypothetical protein GOODEAATRI_026358 [Goodea atripinnis]|uniref:Maturase K n=1 Tax=Goodea atripinnis TaxID=208336 RepID=A0ABV0NNB9_9TELE